MSDETLFHPAREMLAADRAAFLGRTCGSDAALRRRIESLLQATEAVERLVTLYENQGNIAQTAERKQARAAIESPQTQPSR